MRCTSRSTWVLFPDLEGCIGTPGGYLHPSVSACLGVRPFHHTAALHLKWLSALSARQAMTTQQRESRIANRRSEIRRLFVRAATEFDRWESETDRTVRWVFRRYRRNSKRDQVGIKVGVLNALYSAGVQDTTSVADRIYRVHKRLDRLLDSGSLQAIPLMERGHNVVVKKSGIERTFHSFATKYAHWHNPKAFPMYDRYAPDALWRSLQALQPSRRWTKVELEDYRTYRDSIRLCQRLLGLSTGKWATLKRVDQALVILGERIRQLNHPEEFESGDEWSIGRIPAWLR